MRTFFRIVPAGVGNFPTNHQTLSEAVQHCFDTFNWREEARTELWQVRVENNGRRWGVQLNTP